MTVHTGPEGAPESAELEDLLGQCDRGELKLDDAEQHYRKAISLDPTRVVTFIGWPGSCARI